jgi:hypothetical protein
MLENIEADLAALEKAYARAGSSQRKEEILDMAILLCCSGPLPEEWRPLPVWLFEALTRFFDARQPPKTSADERRWLLARVLLGPDPNFVGLVRKQNEATDKALQQLNRRKSLGLMPELERKKPPLKWKEVWRRASEILAARGEPAKPETVRKSYEQIERSLPPAYRRPRTYKRRRPLG